MRVTILQLLLSLFFTLTESKVVRISLDGVGIWSLSNANSTVSTAASVPGYVHTTLQSAGVTGDAYYRFNDDALAWVRQDVWTYTRAFDAPDAVGSAQRVELCFDGIDTVAEVRLNGALVASTENQHRRYRADVTNRVNPTDNKLRVTIYPAVPYGNAEAAKYPLPVPQEKFQPEQLGNRTFVRKQQCDWGWDWGPALAPAGIWRSVAVEAYDEARITDIVPAVSRAAGGAWTVSVRVFARFAGTGVAGSFSAQLAGATAVVNATAPAASCLVGPAAVLSLSVPESAVKLWWPAGYGAQPLYNLTVVFSGAGGETDEMTVRVGFREVEVVEDAIDDKTNPGTSFYLRVNGVPIFGKGSNWIPGDAFDTRFSDSDMRRTLQSAVDANQNIVRVWGGELPARRFLRCLRRTWAHGVAGFYARGSLSPRHQSHLDNWDAEVRDNVRRIASHPSLVVYCGNNEAFKGISSTEIQSRRWTTRLSLTMLFGVLQMTRTRPATFTRRRRRTGTYSTTATAPCTYTAWAIRSRVRLATRGTMTTHTTALIHRCIHEAGSSASTGGSPFHRLPPCQRCARRFSCILPVFINFALTLGATECTGYAARRLECQFIVVDARAAPPKWQPRTRCPECHVL